jgi:hypothetical protein
MKFAVFTTVNIHIVVFWLWRHVNYSADGVSMLLRNLVSICIVIIQKIITWESYCLFFKTPFPWRVIVAGHGHIPPKFVVWLKGKNGNQC